ncbi:MAG: DUF5615 family PIN-like protein [Deltaproteobacteria bacterium]|nr:DUF5615 family PIN-like protein [Deltaproteobacteria bacterium]
MKDETLRLLADESCDFAIVRALRSAGYQVTAVAETRPSAADSEVLEAAAHERQLLLTEDKDFGEWVFAHGRQTSGVLLIRYPAGSRSLMIEAVLELISNHQKELLNAFAVLEPGRVRIRSL